MLALLKYQFGHLFDVKGRDARPTFWWWVLFLVIIQFVLGMLVAIPMTVSTMGAAFNAAASGASEDAMSANMFAEMGQWMRITMISSALLGILAMLMGAASFVRRLHDSGMSGWWATIPLATQIIGLYVSNQMADEMIELFSNVTDPAAMQAAQMEITANAMPWSLMGWVGYAFVIYCGVRGSTDGANAYGEEPVRHSL